MSNPALVVGLPVSPAGDMNTGPGVANVLISGMPASVMGDLVAGTAFSGAISSGSATVLIGGRPAARMGISMLALVNNQSGVAATVPAVGGIPTVLIGG